MTDSARVSAVGSPGTAGRDASNACNAGLPVTQGLFSGTTRYLPGPVEPAEVLSSALECMKLKVP